MSPETRTGTLEFPKVPFPSCPAHPLPQVQSELSVLIASAVGPFTLTCRQSESVPIWVISFIQFSSLPTPARPSLFAPKLHIVPSSLIPMIVPFELENVSQSFPTGNTSTNPLLLYPLIPTISYISFTPSIEFPPANQILPLFFSTISMSVSFVSYILYQSLSSFNF